MVGRSLFSGVAACEDAFERLKEGRPRISEHVGLAPSKITSGIVSVEAGFDRGYLKKARIQHQELIAKIESYRSEGSSRSGAQLEAMKRALEKTEWAINEVEIARGRLYQVLIQNLQLVERVRVLEKELSEMARSAQPSAIQRRQ